MSQVDPSKPRSPWIIDERRGPIPSYPDRPQIPNNISISTSPFPTVSPWTFLAGAVGNIIGGLVGQNRDSGNNQQQSNVVDQMPSMTELMMQFENNRLLRELLKATESKTEKSDFDLGRPKNDWIVN